MDRNKARIDLRFSLIRNVLNKDIANIKEMLELFECTLRSEYVQLSTNFKKETVHLSDEEGEFLAGWYGADFNKLEEIFPKIQRYSLFTTIMSSVESDLCRLCIEMQHLIKPEKQFKKPQKNIIKSCITYLEESCKINLSKLYTESQEIDMYRRIRNCIVHFEGKNSDSRPEEIERFCQEKPTLSIDRFGYIVLGENFLQIAMHVITEFFQQLIVECQNKFKPQPIVLPDCS